MKNSILKVLFVIDKSNYNNKKGLAPLRCRITYKSKRKTFSESLFINPEHWNNKHQKAIPPNEENNFINTQLSLIKSKINQAFLFLQVNQEHFNVEDIHNQYKGKKVSNEIGIIEVNTLFLEYLKKLIGKELNDNTYEKYELYSKHLKGFVKYKFQTRDVKIVEIKSSFIQHYEYYLKTEKSFAQSTINKIIQRFRRTIKYAVAEDYLDKDPFMLYKAKRVKKEVVYLSQEDLKKLENTSFEIKRLQQIKDMFVFCCYTGLAFKEMKSLKKTNIIKGFDGKLWLYIKRAKTSRSYKVPLMAQAKRIIESYNSEESEFVLPRMSNSKFNAYLKEIADIVGIKINLTHHIARKTFATTVLLYNDVPMEIVSKLLGHSKLQTTQEHYADVVEKKVSEYMIKLSEKFKDD